MVPFPFPVFMVIIKEVPEPVTVETDALSIPVAIIEKAFAVNPITGCVVLSEKTRLCAFVLPVAVLLKLAIVV